MTKKGLLVVFSGPSGVGKGAILTEFLKHNPDCVVSVSATTRTPRKGEEHGVNYFFVSNHEFMELVRQGEMLEYAEYNDNYYGSPRRAIDELLNKGRNVFLEIDLNGAMQVKENTPEAVFIFVMPPTWEELRSRLHNRNSESVQSIAKRLEIAKSEIESSCEYDYIIINDDISLACSKIRHIINAEKSRTKHFKDFVKGVMNDAKTFHVSDN